MDPADIEHFKEHGYVVCQVFTEAEVDHIRANFHPELATLNIDHETIINGEVAPPDNIRGKSKIYDILYSDWKLRAQFDPRVYALSQSLMDATFSSDKTINYEHPLSASSELVLFIDMACYRLPDHIRREGYRSWHAQPCC